MAKQKNLDITYIKMCENWAQLSHATRMKVGCLIVKDNQIISDGFNGTPAGFDNICEKTIPHPEAVNGNPMFAFQKLERTKPEVLHAESNAITKLAKSTNSSKGATLYCTLSPCFDCAKLIIQSGIIRVVYKNLYRINSGLDLLIMAGVLVEQINEQDA